MIPNSKIRKAYIDALPKYKVYDIAVPNDEKPPNLYITVNNMTLNEHEKYKQGYEWLVATTHNIWYVNEKGFNSSINLEQVANDIINCELDVDGFELKDKTLFECRQFEPFETDFETIQRMIVVIKHWVSYEG